ncbi:MAG: hypothetical protein ABR909_08100 [Candidatus Bathyarchaeia archaeon]|jgi:hypothetical protein
MTGANSDSPDYFFKLNQLASTRNNRGWQDKVAGTNVGSDYAQFTGILA